MVTVDRIPLLTQAQRDELAQGVIELDSAGRIVGYNRAEARFADRIAAEMVGLDFFTEVAPCAAVPEFQGRFNDFVRGDRGQSGPFTFTYAFKAGAKTVSITFVKRDPAATTFLVVATAQSGSI